jgi:hypothetical protein
MRMLLALIILVFSSVSCISLERAFNWVDNFILYRTTDYFDFSKQEKTEFKKDLKAILNEIQRKDFPSLAVISRDLADNLEKEGAKASRVKKFSDDVEKTLLQAYARFEPLAQKVVSDQSKKGFDRFDQSFLKKNGEDLEKAKNEKLQVKEVKKRFQRLVNETVGFLTTDQEKKLDEFLKNNPPPALARVESQKRVFDKFKEVRKDESKRRSFLNSLFVDYDSLQTPEYEAARKKYEDAFKSWCFTQFEGINDEQKKNFITNLRKHADELQRLSKK